MSTLNVSEHFLETTIQEFVKYKTLGEKAIGQIKSDSEMHWKPGAESNSMAIIIKHLHGNMISRWTDFLTTDGEKPDRHRDNEFIENEETTVQLTQLWNEGWEVVLNTLKSLKPDQVLQNITIRNEPHTVMQALIRQISHYSGHIGQMIYLAKAIRDTEWKTLSIPRGKSEEFNKGMLKS